MTQTSHADGRTADTEQAAPAIELLGVGKAFPGVVALDNLHFSVRRGEVHALIGENGAGKSTAIKVMTGAYTPDTGAVRADGREVRLRDPHEARRLGINCVPQDVLFVPGLSVGRNILLGREGVWSRKQRLTDDESDLVVTALERCGAQIDHRALARTLSVPQLRLMQVARGVLDEHASVLILDEPTAVLSESDADTFLRRLATLRDQGTAVTLVSHRLSEVMRIADRVSVLRDGELVGSFDTEDVTTDELVALMTKETHRPARAGAAPPRRATAGMPGPRESTKVRLPRVRVEQVECGRDVLGVDLEASAGEVIGIAGVQGSGHGALLHALAGARTSTAGQVLLDGEALGPGRLRDRYAKGIVLVSADRRNAAVLPSMTVHTNLALSGKIRRSCRRAGLRWIRRERRMAAFHVERLGIRPVAIDAEARNLSGGNQQKLALARALECEPKVLLIDEPTHGVDVHGKAEIRGILREAAAKGLCVIVASCEFEELLDVADRVYVMRLGKVAAELEADRLTYREILSAALP